MKALALTLFVCTLSLLAQSQWTTSGNDIYNNNTGNVGIGTTTPQYKLDVTAPGSSTALFAQFKNSTGTSILELKENNYVGLWRIYNPVSNRGMYFYCNPNDVDKGGINLSSFNGGSQNNTGSRSMVYIGGYTVGNTSSSGNFTFNNLFIEPTITNPTGTTLSRGIYYNPTFTTTPGGSFTHIAYENTTGSNILNSTSGNTLVGTSTDNGSKLQVNGTTWTTALTLPTGAAAGKVLTSDASGNATWQTASGSSSGWSLTGNTTVNPATTFIGTTDNSPVTFRTGNTERFRIDGTTGNLLFGKTTQSSTEFKIDVNGNVRTTGMVVVATNGADFVFEPSYSLTPLREVEAFIKQNHHLPDIAPAAQMKKEGIDVGDHETRLLQKIEELTLYIIEQDKTNKALQERLDRMEKLLEKSMK